MMNLVPDRYDSRSRARIVLGALAALFLLNAALSFNNWWPTPGIKLDSRLAPEFVLLWVALLVAVRVSGVVSRRLVSWLALAYTVLVIGRYADVTAPALFGREINLYWDGAQIPRFLWVTAQDLPLWQVLAIVAGVLFVLWGLYRLARLGIGIVARDAAPFALRSKPALGATAVAMALVAANTAGVRETWPVISKPVTASFVRQVVILRNAFSPERLAAALPPSPAFDSDLAALAGVDVKLFFLESYGAVAFDNRVWHDQLAGARGALVRRIGETGRSVVSAFVRAPTFGGASDLSHLSLLSGIDLSDPLRHDLLLASKRPTLLSHFRGCGYETYGFYPALSWEWPERAFYGYDRFFEARDLDYRGPEFGYWKIPDQLAIARFHQMNPVEPDSTPRFLFFATINTHAPFRPIPPYQPDWEKLLSPQPFDEAEVARALADKIDWRDLGAPYVRSIEYTYRWLEGYLALPSARDYLLVLVGDHQPLSGVTGEGAPWDVPVHIITSNSTVLERLKTLGFREGLEPSRPTLGGLHDLTQMLLDAFDGRPAAAASRVEPSGAGRVASSRAGFVCGASHLQAAQAGP